MGIRGITGAEEPFPILRSAPDEGLRALGTEAPIELAGRPDNYAGYLTALRDHHGDLPVMITEFGVPSSLGSAHNGALGRDQGDHSEQEALEIDAELLQIIRDVDLAGAFVFSWTDEWFKLTWNTQPRQIPANRRQLWHDVLTNE